ncbi:hypothetical protein KKB18_08700 [bacterium]|nr:hypothetical protein [bacterium]
MTEKSKRLFQLITFIYAVVLATGLFSVPEKENDWLLIISFFLLTLYLVVKDWFAYYDFHVNKRVDIDNFSFYIQIFVLISFNQMFVFVEKLDVFSWLCYRGYIIGLDLMWNIFYCAKKYNVFNNRREVVGKLPYVSLCYIIKSIFSLVASILLILDQYGKYWYTRLNNEWYVFWVLCFLIIFGYIWKRICDLRYKRRVSRLRNQ